MIASSFVVNAFCTSLESMMGERVLLMPPLMQHSLKLFQPATAPLDFLVSENARRATKCKHLELQVSRDEIEAKRAKLIKPPNEINPIGNRVCMRTASCLFILSHAISRILSIYTIYGRCLDLVRIEIAAPFPRLLKSQNDIETINATLLD